MSKGSEKAILGGDLGVGTLFVVMMMLAGSEVGEEHGEGQQVGGHQVLRSQLHQPHSECRECLFTFCLVVVDPITRAS